MQQITQSVPGNKKKMSSKQEICTNSRMKKSKGKKNEFLQRERYKWAWIPTEGEIYTCTYYAKESHFYLDISRGNWIDCYCCRCADNWNRGVARLVACVNPSRHDRWNCFDGIVPALVHDDPFVAPFTQRPKSFLSGLTRDCALQCLVLLLAQQQKPTHPLSTGTAGRWKEKKKTVTLCDIATPPLLAERIETGCVRFFFFLVLAKDNEKKIFDISSTTIFQEKKKFLIK